MTKTVRILVVDDEELIRISTGRMLEKRGYVAESVPSGERAIELVKQMGSRHFGLYIVDFGMGNGMNGHDTTKQLREMGVNAPIVAYVGGWSTTSDDCLAAGMNDYLEKPAEPTDLFTMVAKWTKI